MDRHLQQLRRQAHSGDEQAGLRLAYAECRAGEHILRDDQIILSEEDGQATNQDVGCCQCGQKLFTAYELCDMGHHRLREAQNGASMPLAKTLNYWCVRYVNIPFGPSQEYAGINPLVGASGCNFHLASSKACSKGLHFLQRQGVGKEVCRNPDCDYVKNTKCKKHNLGMVRFNAGDQGQDVSNCQKCWRQFTGIELCQDGVHKPDMVADEACVRKDCNLYKSGMILYAAMVATYKVTGKLEAICRINNYTVAKASGWNEKLKALGIKKPKLPPEKKPRRSKWNKRFNGYSNQASTYSVKIQYTEDNPYTLARFIGNFWPHLRKKSPYSKVSGKLKSYWAGHWYPLTSV